MGVTVEELNDFHRFALSKLEQSSRDDLTIDDLVFEWDSVSNRAQINQAISQGIEDVNGGNHRSVDVVNAELQDKYKLDQ